MTYAKRRDDNIAVDLQLLGDGRGEECKWGVGIQDTDVSGRCHARHFHRSKMTEPSTVDDFRKLEGMSKCS